MASGTEPRAGWYVVNKGDQHICMERTATGWRGFLGELPRDCTLGPRLDDLLRDSAELAAYKDRWAWLRSFIRPSETSKESHERILRDAARYRWLRDKMFRSEPSGRYASRTSMVSLATAAEFDTEIDAEIAREEGR